MFLDLLGHPQDLEGLGLILDEKSCKKKLLLGWTQLPGGHFVSDVLKLYMGVVTLISQLSPAQFKVQEACMALSSKAVYCLLSSRHVGSRRTNRDLKVIFSLGLLFLDFGLYLWIGDWGKLNLGITRIPNRKSPIGSFITNW